MSSPYCTDTDIPFEQCPKCGTPWDASDPGVHPSWLEWHCSHCDYCEGSMNGDTPEVLVEGNPDKQTDNPLERRAQP